MPNWLTFFLLELDATATGFGKLRRWTVCAECCAPGAPSIYNFHVCKVGCPKNQIDLSGKKKKTECLFLGLSGLSGQSGFRGSVDRGLVYVCKGASMDTCGRSSSHSAPLVVPGHVLRPIASLHLRAMGGRSDHIHTNTKTLCTAVFFTGRHAMRSEGGRQGWCRRRGLFGARIGTNMRSSPLARACSFFQERDKVCDTAIL
jgi:hypothetical protein